MKQFALGPKFAGKPRSRADMRRIDVMHDYSAGRVTRAEAMRELGFREVRELVRAMVDSDIRLPAVPEAQFEALAQRLAAWQAKSIMPKRPARAQAAL